MLEAQKIKRLFVTLLKGSPIILVCLIAGLLIARYSIKYTIPEYRSIAKIKLDDHKYGMSSNNLYDDFDVFSSENKIQTEAEILQSPLLIKKALLKLNLTYKIWRKGQFKNTMLFKENPFEIKIDSNFSYKNKLMSFEVQKSSIVIIRNPLDESVIANGSIGEPIYVEGGFIEINPNVDILNEKHLNINDHFLLLIPTEEQFIADIQKNLDVKAVDKEIAVLRVVYTSEDPIFAAEFINTLCEAYVEDYIDTKSKSAQKTLQFIDERMQSINQNLSNSENNLEAYKIEHNVVNTLQETETGLREISKLKLQLINMEMEEKATRDLQLYLSNGDYYENTSINFGFGDLVLTELVKKLKLYTDEKRDLQVKYTDQDIRVMNAQAKIDDVESYIKEAVNRNLTNIEIKRIEIETALRMLESQFEEIPTREKEMRNLEREFMNNETVYNFLFQKKLEAQIASSAMISFHRIIQPAVVSKEPISPNRVLITFVCGFLSLIIGVLAVFGRKIITGKIIAKADIERLTPTPVLGTLKTDKSISNFEQYANLAANIISKTKERERSILITSSIRKEGKTFLTEQLSKVYSQMGYTVAVLHLNPFDHSNVDYTFSEQLSSINFKVKKAEPTHFGYSQMCNSSSLILAHKNFVQCMKEVKIKFDIILMDSPASVISPDAANLVKYCDFGIYLVRSKYSKAQFISNVDLIQEETGFDQMHIVLNGVHHTTNHSGNFNGSKLNYRAHPKGLIKTLKHYFKVYVSS